MSTERNKTQDELRRTPSHVTCKHGGSQRSCDACECLAMDDELEAQRKKITDRAESLGWKNKKLGSEADADAALDWMGDNLRNLLIPPDTDRNRPRCNKCGELGGRVGGAMMHFENLFVCKSCREKPSAAEMAEYAKQWGVVKTDADVERGDTVHFDTSRVSITIGDHVLNKCRSCNRVVPQAEGLRHSDLDDQCPACRGQPLRSIQVTVGESGYPVPWVTRHCLNCCTVMRIETSNLPDVIPYCEDCRANRSASTKPETEESE